MIMLKPMTLSHKAQRVVLYTTLYISSQTVVTEHCARVITNTGKWKTKR